MAKRKVNKRTKEFVSDNDKSGQDPLTDNWKGRIYVTDPEKSFIAKQMNFEKKGEYAIKVQ